MNTTHQLAAVIYAFHPDTQMWDGDPYGFSYALGRDMFYAKRALTLAETLITLDVIKEDALSTLPGQWEILKTFVKK